MKFLATIFLFFCSVSYADAHVPNLVPEQAQDGVITIDDPILSQAFYGELKGFPHTYEIHSTEPFTLFTQILVPDIDSSKNNISGIIIKLPEKSGRVTEITRMSEKEATWESTFEFFGGDSYREGATFTKDLEAGTYRIEMHTPDNLEKYVLVVGTREEMSIGYIETIKRLAGVKKFFNKSPLRVVESPLVYVPLLVVFSIGGFVWYRRRRTVTLDMSQ